MLSTLIVDSIAGMYSQYHAGFYTEGGPRDIPPDIFSPPEIL